MKTILELLEEHNSLPMHMPGHKRNTSLAPYLSRLGADLDITEIDGFDDLHNAGGILMRSMERAANLRGADSAFYLVNGATCGILAGICAAVSADDKVICARNCHKSVYNALELAGAETVFVMPDVDSETGICGSFSPESVKKVLEEVTGVRLIVLTSPTYEGVVSDVTEICRIAHEKNIPVMIDAAHGAHFGFDGYFPESAAACGADIVIESLHKTLPSLTQTAVCWLSGNLIDRAAVRHKLEVFETSSPSYLLMASIDGCFDLLSRKGAELFAKWRENLEYFYDTAGSMNNIKIFENDGRFFDRDKSKIVLLGNGREIACRLRARETECEMAMPGYAVLMTGLGDTRESIEKLLAAMKGLDCGDVPETGISCGSLPEKRMKVSEAKKLPNIYTDYKAAAGRISAEYVWAYPPGVPIIIPGEEISAEIADVLCRYETCGTALRGTPDRICGKIRTIV